MSDKIIKVLNIIGKRPTGGIGSVVYNYQSNFTNENLKSDYMIFANENDGEFDQKVRKLGSKVYVMPELKYTNLFTLIKKIDAFFAEKASQYNAIHLHSVNIGFLCYPIAKKYGIENLIAHSHATMYSDKKLNAIRNYFLCIPLKKWANRYFACSNAAGEFLYGKKAVEDGNVLVLNNAIDCNKFKFNVQVRTSVRKELNIEGKFVVGNVGRFNKQKNHSFLIKIFSEIKKINGNSILLLIGEGPLKEGIKEKVKKLGLENDVIFLGQRSDVEQLLQAMDVFLLPSLYEGLPVIGVEAQATGLPCFMTDTITKEVNINNVQYFSLNENVIELAKKIIDFCETYERCNQNEKVAKAGFDISIEAKKLQEIYLNM
ncbi:MAG: glycosyltransferase family 1 protein [Clostridium sp.]|nr:glycosyltransferase family 1 protein [Clostridium sp.]MDU7084332.1 glycosyltransferase family 1 protein [Clostridium sp.]